VERRDSGLTGHTPGTCISKFSGVTGAGGGVSAPFTAGKRVMDRNALVSTTCPDRDPRDKPGLYKTTGGTQNMTGAGLCPRFWCTQRVRRTISSTEWGHWVVEVVRSETPLAQRLPDPRRNEPLKISVVIPALNEERNIGWVLDRLEPIACEVVLVVADLADPTVPVARTHRPDVQVTLQSRTGKGNALLCGFADCTGNVIVTLDADGSTDPAEIPKFVAALVDGADYAKGSRFLAGGGSADLTKLRRWGNRTLNWLVNRLYGTSYSDLCYGFNAMWVDLVDILGLEPGEAAGERAWGDGFEVETLMNVRVASAGLKVIEVASYEGARRFGASHLSVVADGWRVLMTIRRELKWGQQPEAHARAANVVMSVPVQQQSADRLPVGSDGAIPA
jgi:hypothetical protein